VVDEKLKRRVGVCVPMDEDSRRFLSESLDDLGVPGAGMAESFGESKREEDWRFRRAPRILLLYSFCTELSPVP